MARIRLDLDRTGGSIDRRIFGGFVEHLGRCIYGGVYDPGSSLADAHGFRTDVLEAARALRMPLLRWPGETSSAAITGAMASDLSPSVPAAGTEPGMPRSRTRSAPTSS
jgi:hypothetical protein